MNDLLKQFRVDDSFLGRYIDLVKDTVIPYQEKVLNDEIEGAAKSHAIENFRAAAKVMESGANDGEFYGMVFQDSDVAKWLEAAAYSLHLQPDPELERRCDAIIDLIGRAQHPDGYLNTYFTVKAPDKRWTNLEEAHELYCAGHMMEAAVAYADCTGKTKLLDIMCRMADHIYQRFVVEETEGYPGHPEVELALMRLYRRTQDTKYKQLAEHFINTRGVDSEYFIKESQRHNWTIWGNDCTNKEYTQNHLPVRQQTQAVGHAVRAVYLYTGMADVAAETNDRSLYEACRTLWRNITQRRMYITGAIGSAYEGEAFTKDYHLPNDTAYAETCASIGLIFFARKMLELEKNGEYADVMERALYNCVLAGMQLDGTRFFYVNPLEALPGISGQAITHRHALPQRPRWFACACCPPNVARLLSSIGRYAWGQEGDVVYSHLFIGGALNVSDALGGKIQVSTAYPSEGTVTYRFVPTKESMALTIAIRMPAWSDQTAITLNGKTIDCEIRNGYAYLTHSFTASDEVVVTFDLGVKRVYASSKVSADSGRVAFTRGPLVYCAEGVDNDEDVLCLQVQPDSPVELLPSNELNGMTKVIVEGVGLEAGDALYSTQRAKQHARRVTLIPYYAWSNRGLSQMRVWLPEATT